MENKSKSERKKEMASLQELGERLLELSNEQVREIAIPGELEEALVLARTLKSHGARRRQMQHIGVLMRKIDSEPIRTAIEEIDRGQKRKAHEFHQIEKMRDSLLEGSDAVFEEITGRFPDADIQKIRQLVRSSRKEEKEGRPPKQSRLLFKYLREIYGKR
jgi:ribosome-associated protein